jgi:hypothetical protein
MSEDGEMTVSKERLMWEHIWLLNIHDEIMQKLEEFGDHLSELEDVPKLKKEIDNLLRNSIWEIKNRFSCDTENLFNFLDKINDLKERKPTRDAG